MVDISKVEWVYEQTSHSLCIFLLSFERDFTFQSPRNLPGCFPTFFHIWVCRHIRVFSNVLRHDDKSNPNRQFLLFCIFSTDNPHISFHFSWSNPNFRLVQYHCWLHPQVDCVDNSDKPHVFYLEYQVSFLVVNLLLIWILVPWQIWIWSSIVLPSGNLT